MTNREKFETWVRNTMGQTFLNHEDSPALWGGDTTEHDDNPYEHPWTRGAWDGYRAALGHYDWIPWQGNKRSGPNAGMVEVQFRGGDFEKDFAYGYYWLHDGSISDIIAYRIIKE